jgi:hypothetical protein
MWLGLTGFMGAVLFSFISVGLVKGSNKSDMLSAILTVMSVNGVLCLVLAGIGIFSIRESPIMKRPYIFFLVHASLILSIIGVCVSSLRRLGIDPSLPVPSGGASGLPPTDPTQVALGLGSTGFVLGVISIVAIVYMYYRPSYRVPDFST